MCGSDPKFTPNPVFARLAPGRAAQTRSPGEEEAAAEQ
jgi:hypothetical protein